LAGRPKPTTRRPADILTAAEAQALIWACGHGVTAVRNRAMVSVFWRCGLRVSEALSLAVWDVDTENGSLRVHRGKGDVSRSGFLDPGTAALIAAWLERRRDLGIPRKAPLFCTLRGGRLDDRYVRQLMPRLGKRAGIEKRVHAHMLRHTFSMELAREGQPVALVQRAMGHASVRTTGHYLSHFGDPELLTAIRSREWTPPPVRRQSARARAPRSKHAAARRRKRGER
jgi:site-specific recombinase XerD